MSKYLKFNNFSTILNSILLTIFGLLLGYLTTLGYNLPVSADVLSTVIGGLILFVFSYYNAKHHNDLFDKENDSVHIPLSSLSDEQIDILNELIEIGEEKCMRQK